jgi:aminoglycoside phosphotransferase family enzyme/predicted kinase
MTALAVPATMPGAGPDAVAEAVERRVGAPVRRHETHGSIVFVAGDRAFKLRKPVNFAFADLRAPQHRRELALADAALAAPLAPDLVLGTLDVVPRSAGAVELVPSGTELGAIDIVTELRRYDERRTLLHLVREGEAGEAECRAVGRRIAEFHSAARPAAAPPDARAVVDRNLEEVLPLLGDLLPARERFAIQRFLDAFLFAWAESLRARAAAGLVLDAHGDLRAEHVLLEGDAVQVVDRLEFADLRAVDVADELAFLRMELLDLTGDDALGDAVLDGYRDAGGTVPPHALLAFFGVHRALVRAKVALLRAAQVHGEAADDAVAHAFHLLSVARRLIWRARGRPILLVTGPPASGKSTLAAALRETARLPVLSSDELRPRAEEEGADYSPAGREAVYRDLATRADAAGPCVIDATFGDEGVQRAFLAALPRDRRPDLVVVACHAPLVDRVERARRRAAAGDSLSDADPEVVVQLAELSQVPVFPHAPRLAVDTQVPIAAQVDLVESWMDARLAASGD